MPTERTPATPPVTRSQGPSGGGKDKRPVQRTLSDPSSGLSAELAAAIQTAVNNALNSDVLLTRLADKISYTINENLTAALQAANSRIDQLTAELTSLRGHVQRQEARHDDLAQYQRRNNLRVFGIPEAAGEDTDALVLEVFKNQIGVNVDLKDIDRSHRAGRAQQPQDSGETRPRPILVKFVSYRQRRAVFAEKKKLKGTKVTIREDLTALRLATYKKAVAKYGIRRVWTQDGRVRWISERGDRGVATCENDIA